jgi:hypothetical protein
MLQGGTQITPISEQRVKEWFWKTVNPTFLHRVTAGIDPVNSSWVVSFPDINSSDGTPNHLISYFWAVDRWTHAQPGPHEMIFSGATQVAWTIEQVAAVYPTIEQMPFPWDSVVWTGVARRMVGAFDTAHTFGFFAGASLAPTVTTTEVAVAGQRMARITNLRPQVDGGTPSVAIGMRNRQIDGVTYGPAVPVNSNGECPQHVTGRYARGTITLPAGQSWNNMLGIDDIVAQPEGRQ